MVNNFTEEELSIAKIVDLVAVASSLGYTPKKIGKYYTLKEMDSIRIYDRTHWYRWSRQFEKGENGGSQIDFLKVFCGMDIKEAVFWLLDFSGYRPLESRLVLNLKYQVKRNIVEKQEFILPRKAVSNNYLYQYLNEERKISKAVIDYFVNQNLIYESEHYHNIVFKGNDQNGVTRFASMRGVFDKNGKAFKCDVSGNDKNYGFNVVHPKSNRVFVFEAAIDLMSFVDINLEFESNMIALGMLSDAPLITFLSEHTQISTICFCLDNDEPGKKATKELLEKYYELGFDVENLSPPEQYKDYNAWLSATKLDIKKSVTKVQSK